MKTSIYKSNLFPIEITKQVFSNFGDRKVRYELTVNGNVKVLTYDMEFIYLKAHEYEEIYKRTKLK